MRNLLRVFFVLMTALAVFVTSACAEQRDEAAPGKTNERKPEMAQINTLNNDANGRNVKVLTQDQASVPIVQQNNTGYVPLKRLTELLNYNSDWDEAARTYRMGDTGVEYEIHINSDQAVRGGEQITLKTKPILIGGQPHLSVSDMSAMFKEDMTYRIEDDALLIFPSAIHPGVGIDDEQTDTPEELDFGDDPEDPADIEASKEADISIEADDFLQTDSFAVFVKENPELAVPALKNININSLIKTSKKYLGVKYKFGTGPYPKTKRFDCSTFTQYVYGKYGITLPRTARAQARKGISVSRKSLRKGDLLFFYVPGRFRTNKVVGHVGIYIGNKKMIHASPKPKNGVQISSINSAYWKRTFLKARRIAK